MKLANSISFFQGLLWELNEILYKRILCSAEHTIYTLKVLVTSNKTACE